MLTVDAPGGDRLAVNGTLLVKVVIRGEASVNPSCPGRPHQDRKHSKSVADSAAC